MVVRVTAMVGAVVVMVTLVGWAFRNNEAERREAQLRRFDARAVTGAGFVQAYVSETSSRQSRLATAADARAGDAGVVRPDHPARGLPVRRPARLPGTAHRRVAAGAAPARQTRS